MNSPADAQRGVDTERIARRWGYGRRRPNPFKPSEFDIHLLLGEVERLHQREAAMRQIHAEQIRQLARSRDWWRRRWERQVDENELRQQNAALLMVALRARDVWGSWGRVDSKLEALGHALAEPAAQELVTAALAQGESNQGGWQ